MKTPFPAQVRSVERLDRLITTRRSALDTSETGTGKTLKSVLIALKQRRPLVVVCPKAVVPTWRAQLAEAGIEPLFLGTYEKLRRGVEGIVKKSGKRTYKWFVPDTTLIVWDEVHKSKGTKSQNGALLCAAKPFQNLLLSATPFDNPSEMRAIGYVLGLHRLDDFYPWACRYGCELDRFRSLKLRRNPDTGETLPEAVAGMKALAEQIAMVSDMVRMGDLPLAFRENLIITDPIDFKDAAKIDKAYAECGIELEELERIIAGDFIRAENNETTVNALTELLRARQKAELFKVAEIVEMIRDHVEQGKSVAVFLNFIQTLEAVQAKLGLDCSVIRGGQTEGQRQEHIDAFNRDERRVILSITSAGGVGVNLHDVTGKHPRVSIISPTFNPKEFKQVLGRIYRIGMLTDAMQIVLVAAGTIEGRVVKLMQEKIANGDVMLSGISQEATTDPVEQPAHAEFGPSGLKSLKICPGFENTGGTSAAAEMGTRCHLAMETHDDGPLENDWEMHLVNLCRQAENAIVFHHFQHIHDQVLVSEQYQELRMGIPLPHGCSTFGTSDKLYIHNGVCVQIDYKFGKMLVDEPEQNLQAKAYSVGTFIAFPDVNEVHFYFLQPQNDTISHGVFYRHQLEELQEELASVILGAKIVREQRRNGFAIDAACLNPTPGTCDFCKHCPVCPAVTTKAVEVALAYTGTPAQQATVHGSAIEDGETLAQHLVWAPILETWAKGVRKRGIQFIEQGGTIPGYDLVERSGGRKVDNPMLAIEIAAELGVPHDAIMRLASVPWTDLEELVKATAPRGKKKAVAEQFEASLFGRGGLTYQKSVTQLKRTKTENKEDE